MSNRTFKICSRHRTIFCGSWSLHSVNEIPVEPTLQFSWLKTDKLPKWYLRISISSSENHWTDWMEKEMAPHSSTLAWKIPWMEEPGRLQSMGLLRQTWLRNFTFIFRFHALEKEMATHSSVLAWRVPGTEEPDGLLPMGLHRVGHDWSDLAAAAAG